jgi:hypothetical protein
VEPQMTALCAPCVPNGDHALRPWPRLRREHALLVTRGGVDGCPCGDHAGLSARVKTSNEVAVIYRSETRSKLKRYPAGYRYAAISLSLSHQRISRAGPSRRGSA